MKVSQVKRIRAKNDRLKMLSGEPLERLGIAGTGCLKRIGESISQSALRGSPAERTFSALGAVVGGGSPAVQAAGQTHDGSHFSAEKS